MFNAMSLQDVGDQNSPQIPSLLYVNCQVLLRKIEVMDSRCFLNSRVYITSYLLTNFVHVDLLDPYKRTDCTVDLNICMFRNIFFIFGFELVFNFEI